ncbi:hypothetical protein ASA1KI_19620 [Opitutales bacterium ASA1]|nr:hypothetical protein ASA1KI_19620 [Opitutales bacterium ASA1]
MDIPLTIGVKSHTPQIISCELDSIYLAGQRRLRVDHLQLGEDLSLNYKSEDGDKQINEG